MKRTFVREAVRKKRFLEAYEGWNQGRLSQEEAAEQMGMRAQQFPALLGAP
jgi:hypothetical protein